MNQKRRISRDDIYPCHMFSLLKHLYAETSDLLLLLLDTSEGEDVLRRHRTTYPAPVKLFDYLIISL